MIWLIRIKPQQSGLYADRCHPARVRPLDDSGGHAVVQSVSFTAEFPLPKLQPARNSQSASHARKVAQTRKAARRLNGPSGFFASAVLAKALSSPSHKCLIPITRRILQTLRGEQLADLKHFSITPPVPGPAPGPRPDPEPRPGSDPDVVPPLGPEPEPDDVPIPTPEPEPMPL